MANETTVPTAKPTSLAAWIKRLDEVLLPVPQASHDRVCKAIRDSRSSLRDIAELMQNSPALVLSVMREANSHTHGSLAEPAENLEVALNRLGLKRAEVLRKFASIAEFAGIGDYMDQPVKHYSMGMRTRLAFSICAHVEAEILVVDEALSVGDAAFQRKCLDWIDDFRKTGTLLFVSHSMAEVRRLCSRAIWIEDGRIREQGDPNEVIRSYHRALLVEKDDVHRFSAGGER